jgi:hypothetical protein
VVAAGAVNRLGVVRGCGRVGRYGTNIVAGHSR